MVHGSGMDHGKASYSHQEADKKKIGLTESVEYLVKILMSGDFWGIQDKL